MPVIRHKTADAREILQRELKPRVSAWDHCQHLTGCFIPRGHRFRPVFIQGICVCIHTVHRHLHLDVCIPPPLRPLTVRAVHEGIAHAQMQRVIRLLPKSVQKIIIAAEAACPVGGIFGPSVPKHMDGGPGRQVKQCRLPVHPPQGFVFLQAFLCDVYAPESIHIRRIRRPIGFCTDLNPLPCRRLHPEKGCKLHIRRELHDQRRIALGCHALNIRGIAKIRQATEPEKRKRPPDEHSEDLRFFIAPHFGVFPF